MGKLKSLWYRFVASELLAKLVSREDDYQTLLDAYVAQTKYVNSTKLALAIAQQEVKEWQGRATTENRDAAIAVQVIRERMNQNPCILNAREIAVKQRINDLEVENSNLKKDNAKLRREHAERFIDPYDH